MSSKISKGDVVLASGYTKDVTGLKKIHRKLAKVVTVGKYDIFVINTPKGTYDLPFRIPISRCQKIEVVGNFVSQDVKKPKIELKKP